MGQPQITGVAVPQQEVEAVLDLVAAVEKAQQAAAPEDFLVHFRPDAIWTTGHGKLLTGLDEIAAFTRRVLPPTADAPVTASYTAEHILFIRPDLAAVKVRQRPLSREGGHHLDEIFHGHPDPASVAQEHPEARPGTPTYVLAKDAGTWRIAAAQNTTVQDPDTLARP
ncbi:SgcJ/EcaC family oxidoreductase [Kitasatospora sp. NPDC096147]|uniref:SgcJ/EcaC family oxidoreductase n=1 Tax=Kitasatospora sp. NPDC096147 TaxID=3364093 RepID=UPI0038230626